MSLSLEELKMVLLDSLIGTDRGLDMGSRLRGEVLEYINLLEAQNPTAKPTEASELLAGRWRLRFTAASELAVLRLPQQIPGIVQECNWEGRVGETGLIHSCCLLSI